ncbi:MAG TPA: hypothetical protein VG963_13590, partial [Polyangiaceae bacterium]|nr:hypothetical protein [Polyangiaceae bacterium]
MLSFRDSVQRVSGERLEQELLDRVWRVSSSTNASAAERLALALRAGELESALEDLAHPAAARVRRLSDAAAEACQTASCASLESWLRDCASLPCAPLALPRELCLRRPEGYAYYALSPAAYVQALEANRERSRAVAVIGIRSIGTSLAAAVLAGLRARGARAERITVRPGGPAWDRKLEPNAAFSEFVARWHAAHFLIVDEGPGLSGSTFLAVAEALECVGVPREQIELLASHAPDPCRLLATDAARRWSRYRVSVAPAPRAAPGSADWSAGAWRAALYTSESEWPPAEAAFERHKYRAPGSALIKFIGQAPYADAPLSRGQLLAEAGFCPELRPHGWGYVAQRWVEGCPLRAPVTNPRHLHRLLDYLVFRSRHCRAEDAEVMQLQRMLQVNVAEALGCELPSELRLEVEHPVYADARLGAEEWIETAHGELIKVDACDHGDDHFFPGPCDSAWDIAGAILEWQLEDTRARELCVEYRRQTGDDVACRLAPYLLAYTAARLARVDMAS